MYLKGERKMCEKIPVQMTEKALFDFTLFHTYSKFAGFLTNVLGMAVGFMGIILLALGKATWVQTIFYLLAAAAFLGYTPLLLKFRAKKQMQTMRIYRDVCDYEFNENGITVWQVEEVREYGWDRIQKVVATPKTIGFYYGVADALIIPKESFGEKFMPVMRIVTANVSRDRIKIR